MRLTIVALYVILLCAYGLSSDHQNQSEGLYSSQEPIRVLARVTRRTIKCYQGPICQRFIDCLRFAPRTDCE